MRVHVCGVYGPDHPGGHRGFGCADIGVTINPDGTHYVELPDGIPDATAIMVRRYVLERLERSHRQAQAEARAQELLVRVLTDEQRQTFERNKYVDVTGSAGGAYRIYCGPSYSGNIRALFGMERAFCVYPAYQRPKDGESMPRHDAFLGQLLLIATDEPKFLKVAVHYGV